MPGPIRLVLVEDNQVFREALELLLGLRSDIEVVASVAEGTSAADVVREHKPDVVLMDYRLPGIDGVQATKAVREAAPNVAVVCLTASANLREVDALYEAGVVAVVAGDGNRALFEDLGATEVVSGGQTMNPSTAELVEAVETADAQQLILLPNNSNVILSAQQAAELASKPVTVVATDSIQAGLAAMVSFLPERSAAENASEMSEVLEAVVTGEVTVASSDAELDGLAVRKGAWLGLAAGRAVAVGDEFDDVAGKVTESLLAEPRMVMTLLTGADAPDVDPLLARLRERHPELEFELHAGGQPHYALLLSAE